jgi:hypothetical protein
MTSSSRRSYFRALVFGTLLLSACSTAPKSKEPAAARTVKLDDSSGVEIRYVFQHNHYRLEMRSENGKVEATNGVNEQPLERRTIHPGRYSEFLKKASTTAEEIERASRGHEFAECKVPFTLRLLSGGKAKKEITGCRTNDPHGKIGRLIQEGEFLFYGDPVSKTE